MYTVALSTVSVSQRFITKLLFRVTDLRDDLQYGAVLRDPQQPGLLEVQTAVLAAMKDELAAAFSLSPFCVRFLKQELSLILLAGCSQLFEKMM